MEDIVHFTGYVHELGHVVVVKIEPVQVEKVLYVPQVARDEVVHPDDMMAFGDEPIAKMGAEKTCCSGDECFFQSFVFFFFGGFSSFLPFKDSILRLSSIFCFSVEKL